MHVWSSLPEAEPELRARVAQLMLRPFDELQRLPKESDAGHGPLGIEFTLNRRDRPDGRVEIVLQAYRPGRRFLFVKFGQMAAQGFWASPSGSSPAPMPPEALYEYA